jgi:multidrug efflux pump subunit AcrA (membrane-fusion protein)
VELTRAQEVHDNANRLLEALASSPSLESLRDTDWGAMGKARSDLVAAYAELQYAQATYDREKQLFERKITSADEFRKAESGLEKAEAIYEATRDRVAFDVQYQLLEATRAQQVREFQVIGAERSLYVLGLTAGDVSALQKLAVAQSASGAPAEACTDPDCVDCAKERAELAEVAATLERENERLAWYPLRAPFDGTVISKHLSLGESVKDGADVFVMADLATVWVDFRIHQKDLATIGAGQAIVVESGADRVAGVIAYVAPVVDEDTRTALARVVLPNPEGRFRPGTFVNGVVTIVYDGAPVVVERAAIQYIDDQPCVFVYDGHAFEKRNVILGRTDGQRTEIKAGLQPGENVVTKNAFRVKAESEKAKTASSGHGHVH